MDEQGHDPPIGIDSALQVPLRAILGCTVGLAIALTVPLLLVLGFKLWKWDEQRRLAETFRRGDRLGAAYEIYKLTKGEYPNHPLQLVEAGIVAAIEPPTWGDDPQWDTKDYTLFAAHQNVAYPLIYHEPGEWMPMPDERRPTAEALVLAISRYRLEHTASPASLRALRDAGYLSEPHHAVIQPDQWIIEPGKYRWLDRGYVVSYRDNANVPAIEVYVGGNWFTDF